MVTQVILVMEVMCGSGVVKVLIYNSGNSSNSGSVGSSGITYNCSNTGRTVNCGDL